MNEWRPDLRDEDDPVRSALELGLRRQPLSSDALARVRQAVRAEFDALHGWRAETRRWPRWMLSVAATLAGLTVVAAVCLFQGEAGPPFGSVVRVENGSLQMARSFFGTQDLPAGADVPSLEGITSGGTSLIALAHGGLLHVAPGTSFEGTGADEVVLKSGHLFLDFPEGAGRLVLRTPGGVFEHIGTQFEAAVEGEHTRIRVREGVVRMSGGAAAPQEIEAGTEVVVSEGGAVARRSVPTYGPDWAWVDAMPPEFEIDNRALSDFLGWVARETGRKVEFADDRAREVAGRTLLHGSVHGLAPLAALEQVLSTTSLRCEVHGDVIEVSSRQ